MKKEQCQVECVPLQQQEITGGLFGVFAGADDSGQNMFVHATARNPASVYFNSSCGGCFGPIVAPGGYWW